MIENAQRDINIAFMNEIAQIFAKLGLSMWDVLAAAGTKWNFLDVPAGPGRRPLHRRRPLLSQPPRPAARPSPEVILAGRATNDRMGRWIADALHDRRQAGRRAGAGLTFKENVPDLRNSRVLIWSRLKWSPTKWRLQDPVADAAEIDLNTASKVGTGRW